MANLLIFRRTGVRPQQGSWTDHRVRIKSENGGRRVWCVSTNVRQNARQRPETRLRMRNGEDVVGSPAFDEHEDHSFPSIANAQSRHRAVLCAFRARLALSLSSYTTPPTAWGHPPPAPTAAASWTPAGPAQTGTRCRRCSASWRCPSCRPHHSRPARADPPPTRTPGS